MDKRLILRYLDCRRLPLLAQGEDARMHHALCEGAPEFYLHLLADPVAHISHKREVLLNLLLAEAGARQAAERQRLLDMLNVIPVAQGLQVVGVIYDLRINRSRARELALAYLLGHERLPELAAIKRQRLGRLLRHVLGERTWSSVRRSLASPTPEGEQFLQREVLRYAWKGDAARAREVLCFLTGVPFEATIPALVRSLSARQDISQGKGLPDETLSGLRGVYHRKVPIRFIRRLAAPVPVSTRVDGPLTAAYKEELAKGEVGQEKQRVALAVMRGLLEVLKQRVEAVLSKDEGRDDAALEQVTDRLPKLEGRVAVVLDMSGSMASSGERQNHPAALALALTRLLRESVSDLRLFQTGGSASFEEDGLSRPQGVADIAQALLEAVQSQPQLVLIITDGYENLRQGDSAWIVEGLRRLGYGMPIYQVVPLFAGAEKLELRRLDEDIPLIPIVHEEHVSELLGRVLLTTVGEHIAVEELQQLQRLLTKR